MGLGIVDKQFMHAAKYLQLSGDSWPANTKLRITTVPYRHELPANHNVNQETVRVKAYIEELAIRHNIPLLYINIIEREVDVYLY
ncbi:hypothetical protein J6590_087884 [Homalodisca vitripennis]|nr:hypothetical protein J6590_087884 [Homalodisca vitripennis]